MSLVGTLSDLSIEELLQLVALTRRSGVLELRAPEQVVWIGLRAGSIVRVAASGPGIDGSERSEPTGSGRPPWLDLLLGLFEWEQGDFWFEGWVDPDVHWPGPEGMAVDPPLSPQFLALEGLRLEDERQAGAAPPLVEPPPETPAASSTCAPPPAVVVIDSDLGLLEAIKRVLLSPELPVHIFQRSDEGLIRLKQYLVRGAIPALVVGMGAVDPLEPRRKPGWRALARRARSLAPAIRIVLLSADALQADGDVNAVLARPSAPGETPEEQEALLERLVRALGVRA